VATSRGFFEPASLASLYDQSVHAGVDGLERCGKCWHHVEHGEPGGLELGGVPGRISGGGGDEADALLYDELHDRRIAHEELCDVHAERPVGELAHGDDLASNGVELAR
jgi:hypothetical protein